MANGFRKTKWMLGCACAVALMLGGGVYLGTSAHDRQLMDEIVKRGGGYSVEYVGPDILPAWARECPRLLRVTGIYTHGYKIDREGFRQCCMVTSLTRLQVSAENLTSDDLIQLASCKSLKMLSIHDASCSDEWLAVIPQLPNLEILQLTNVNLTAAGIDKILDKHSLESLSIQGRERLYLDPTARWSALDRLQEIAIVDGVVSDEMSKVLAAMPSLNRVVFVTTLVSPESVQRLMDRDIHVELHDESWKNR